MGIADFFSDLYSSMGFPEAHADAPAKDDDDGSKEEGGDEDKGEGEGDEKEGGDDKEEGGPGDEEGGEEKEEEEEEDDEPVDQKAKLEEGEFSEYHPTLRVSADSECLRSTDCARSSQCSGYKHHYEECVERVTYQHEHPEQFKGHKEDCVEECANWTQILPFSTVWDRANSAPPQSSTSSTAPPNALHLSSSKCSSRASSAPERWGCRCGASARDMKLFKPRCQTSQSSTPVQPFRTLARIAWTASVSIVFVS